jgi:hypothetical protein
MIALAKLGAVYVPSIGGSIEQGLAAAGAVQRAHRPPRRAGSERGSAPARAPRTQAARCTRSRRRATEVPKRVLVDRGCCACSSHRPRATSRSIRLRIISAGATFDNSLMEVWGGLLVGCPIGVIGDVVLSPPGLLARDPASAGPLLHLTPTQLRELLAVDPQTLSAVDVVDLGGERVDQLARAARRIAGPALELLGRHGCAVDRSAAGSNSPLREPALSVGLPIGATSAYVLDDQLRRRRCAQPALHRRHRARARLPRRSAAMLRRSCPTRGRADERRMYATGDRCFADHRGAVTMTGRLDHQGSAARASGGRGRAQLRAARASATRSRGCDHGSIASSSQRWRRSTASATLAGRQRRRVGTTVAGRAAAHGWHVLDAIRVPRAAGRSPAHPRSVRAARLEACAAIPVRGDVDQVLHAIWCTILDRARAREASLLLEGGSSLSVMRVAAVEGAARSRSRWPACSSRRFGDREPRA